MREFDRRPWGSYTVLEEAPNFQGETHRGLAGQETQLSETLTTSRTLVRR